MTPADAALLVGAGLAAGFVNTVAGGGSVLTVPALILLGLPADVANGSSRVSVVAQSGAAALAYRRAGQIERAVLFDAAPATLAGALAGSLAATRVPNRWFEVLLVTTMLAIAALLLLRPQAIAPPPDTPARPAGRRLGAQAALAAAGFYGGLLQVGVGFVLLAVFAGVLRLDLVRGNALKTAVVAAYSVVALAVFAATGRIAWWHGLVLASGSVIGAQAGVRFAVKRGAEVVRKVTVVAVLAVAAAVVARWL